MTRLYEYLRTHKFESYAIAFLLMVVPPLPMFYAAQQGSGPLVIVMLGFVVLGNLLVLVAK